jgi:hypothetical protein
MSALTEDELNDFEEQLKEFQEGRDGSGGKAFEGSIANVAKADALIGSILRRDANLITVVADNDRQLAALTEEYVSLHVKNADDIVAWYNEMTQCEEDIKTFESDIETFQSQLTDTAEDIVKMQQETLRLMKRVDNRRVVSQRLKQVYDALMETEEFCDHIVKAPEVNEKFMQSIRQLESKISFLADVEELKGSAVHQEIHPRLQVAALRAGDKLHQYLLKKFHALAEEGTNVAMGQQALERQGAYSFSFLSRYNTPIAQDLSYQYVRIVSDVHVKHIKAYMKEVAEVSGFSAAPFDPIVRPDLLSAIQQNVDNGTPQGKPLPIRKSVSKRADKKEHTFEDSIKSLKAISFEHQLHVDPIISRELRNTTSLTSRLADVLCRTANDIIAEALFVSHFFFARSSAGTPDDEEAMLRSLCGVAIQNFENLLLKVISDITDHACLTATLRVVELVKSCASQVPNPLPLCLLAGFFENVANNTSKRIQALLAAHLKSLSQLTQLELTPLKQSQGGNLTLPQRVEGDSAFGTALRGPHDLTLHFLRTIGEVELLNSLPLIGSKVSFLTARHFFDEKVSHAELGCFSELRKGLSMLGKRYGSLQGMQVVTVSNLAYLLIVLRTAFEELSGPHSPTSPLDGHQERKDLVTSLEIPSSDQSPLMTAIQSALKDELKKLIDSDLETSQLSKWYFAVDKWRHQLGPAFEARAALPQDDASEVLTRETSELVGTDINEDEMLNMATSFQKVWKEAMTSIGIRIATLFAGRDLKSGSASAPSTGDHPFFFLNAIRQGNPYALSSLIAQLVLQTYFQCLLDANKVFTDIARSFFAKNANLTARLVGNVALTHAAANELRNLAQLR